MKPLIYYTPGKFEALIGKPDVRIWLGLFRIFNYNVSFCDRTGTIVNPILTTTPAEIALPDPNPDFNLNFDDCAVSRAEEIYNKHKEFGVPIRLGWSGGIDSTAALMSFVKLLGVAETRRCVEVAMTSHGIVENPYTWEKLIRKEKFTVINSLEFSEKWDGSEIMVNGECGDQVHGTDIYLTLIRLYGVDGMVLPWTTDNILDFIKLTGKLTDRESEILAQLLINQVKQAPIEITTMADFWWWLNFSCKWGSTCYRIVTKSTQPVNGKYLSNFYFPFYASTNFQLWSMYKREEKHKGNWSSYKWRAKDFTCNVLGDDGFQMKHRQGSLVHVLSHTKKFDAIDSDFNFFKDADPETWYNPNNSFA